MSRDPGDSRPPAGLRWYCPFVFGMRKRGDSEPRDKDSGVVTGQETWAIRPNEADLKDAARAGRHDGKTIPPIRGEVTPWLLEHRAAIRAELDGLSGSAKQKIEAGSALARGLKADRKRLILKFSDLNAVVSRLDHTWANHVHLQVQLEEAYLREAEEGWQRRGHVFEIPDYVDDHDTFLQQLRDRIAMLRTELRVTDEEWLEIASLSPLTGSSN